MSKRYLVRDLIDYTKEQIWALPDEMMEVVFDDNTVVRVSARSTIFSWYHWLFFRMDKTAKVLPEHHWASRTLTKREQLKFMGNNLFSVVNHIRKSTKIDITQLEGFWKMVYEAQSDIYNTFKENCAEYATTISALDFIEALDHPEIAESNANTKPNEASIRENHDTIKRVLADPTALPGNRLARNYQIGAVDIKQQIQCIGQIGFRTEIDSGLFPVPIMTNFSEGLKKIHDLAIESRSASKSLMYTKSPLADTQYFNREMQLEACVVADLHHDEDCGTTMTIPFHVTAGSLDVLDGKWHKLENGELELIRPWSRHLIGSKVELRSPLGCKHGDSNGVCGTCFGELQWSIPKGTNIGHACVVEICEKISQLVLSVKHIDSSSTAESMKIDDCDVRFLVVGSAPNTIGIKPWISTHQPKIRFRKASAPSISLIDRVADVGLLNVWEVSAFDSVYITTINRTGEVSIPVTVSMGSRYGSFTEEFLNHIKQVGLGFSDGDLYEVSLENWDYSKDIFQLPLRHRNMLEYKQLVEEFIKGGKRYEGRLGRPFTAAMIGAELQKFHELISAKLSINIVHLETVLYSTAVRSVKNKDYRLPRGLETGYEFAAYNDLLANRSLTPAMAYQGQRARMTDIDSYMIRVRPPSPLDDILRDNW